MRIKYRLSIKSSFATVARAAIMANYTLEMQLDRVRVKQMRLMPHGNQYQLWDRLLTYEELPEFLNKELEKKGLLEKLEK